jgi:hypothetical protein
MPLGKSPHDPVKLRKAEEKFNRLPNSPFIVTGHMYAPFHSVWQKGMSIVCPLSREIIGGFLRLLSMARVQGHS